MTLTRFDFWRKADWWLVGILLVGLAFRLPWMELASTKNTRVWKTWAYRVSAKGLTDIYRLQQEPELPLSLQTLAQAFRGNLPVEPARHPDYPQEYPVDYPPGMYYIFSIVALGYRTFVSPTFAIQAELDAAIRIPLVLAELVTTLLLWRAVRWPGGSFVAHSTAAAYWLNPAVLLNGTILIYLDALYIAPLVAGLIFLTRRRWYATWAGWAVAVAVKPQPLLLLPALLALSVRRGWARLLAYGSVAGAVLLGAALPMILTGHTLALIANIANNTREPGISYFQFNVWWLWSYLYEATHGGRWAGPTAVLYRDTLLAQGGPDLRPWSGALFALFTLLMAGAWWARQRRAAANEATGVDALVFVALQFYGALLLIVGVHENHPMAALAVFVLAAGWAQATGQRTARLLWLVTAGVTAILSAQMIWPYGLGQGVGIQPLSHVLFGVDASVLLTILNLSMFALLSTLWACGGFQEFPHPVTKTAPR